MIPNRVDIDQRPAVVAAKSRIGDWEADTIIGANHRGAVMSHVERKSKYTKLAKLADTSADSVLQACARVLLPLADRIGRTGTLGPLSNLSLESATPVVKNTAVAASRSCLAVVIVNLHCTGVCVSVGHPP